MKSKLAGFVIAMLVLGVLMTIYGEGAIRASPQPRPKTKEETVRAASEEFVMEELSLKATSNKDQITPFQLERIFVSNEGANKITVVDSASLRILTSINIGPKPHNLVYSEGFVFVATQGSNEISAVDVSNLHQVRRIFIGTIPHDVATEGGQQVLVLSPSGRLTLVELPSGKVRQQVKLKGRPHNLALVGDKIWITDITAPLVHIVNIQKKMVVRRASLPGPGRALALHPTVQEVWITPWASNEIAIHADGNTDPRASGFKVASAYTCFPRFYSGEWRQQEGQQSFFRQWTSRLPGSYLQADEANKLVQLLEKEYQQSTDLDIDRNVSHNMCGYYAFN